ncbi:MAG: hypothetical protein IIU83_04260 [Fibrobacteraceae bacterium]|nr:hypothetical protein [Fibrobacteraceae bacterium]
MAIALISVLSIRSYKQSKRKNNMQYTIIATVTKIDEKGVYIKGVGKYLFEDSNKKLWNLLEETPMPPIVQEQVAQTKIKLIDLQKPLNIQCLKVINCIFFANAMLQRKPLKLLINETDNPPNSTYSIEAIEVP